ncbi:MAG: VWA domain-containing protein [Gemmatimonadota bacterium]
MTLGRPELLWLLPIVLGIVGIGARAYLRRRRRLADMFGGREAGRRLTGVDLYRPPWGALALLTGALVAIILALAEPRLGGSRTVRPQDPWDILIAVDISRSMQANDVVPTRLGRAREVALEIVEALPSQRVGLLMFAGQTYMLTPPTPDHGVVRFYIDGLDPELVSERDEGTLLGAVLAGSQLLFERQVQPRGGRALVLLTDGDLHADGDEAMQAVRALSDEGIRVFTVGIGTVQGSGLNVPHRPGRWGGPLLHDDGTLVHTRLDETRLRQIASRGGGSYASAASPSDLDRQLQEIAALSESGTRTSTSWFARTDSIFWLSLMAVLLLAIESAVATRQKVPLGDRSTSVTDLMRLGRA